MCGINLIISSKGDLGDKAIIKMNQALAHRGPDFTSYEEITFRNSRIYAGHTRLKIIDLSDAANQPFTAEDNRYLLIYNGEIYNFHDLKNQLIDLGYHFKSSSDTETLYHWLVENGQHGVRQLNGMFAFIFIDKVKQQILCARDASGMKPLYYYHDNNYLIISSEIKGLLASGLITKELNRKQVINYLNFRHARAPETFYKHIYEVPAGTLFANGLSDGHLKFVSFKKKIPTSEEKLSRETIITRSEELLIDAVGRHLVADVPVGIFLSGGVDSTLITALARSFYDQPLYTFSISYGKTEGSFGTRDQYFAGLAARQYGTYHENVEIGPGSLQTIDSFLDAMDQPVGDSAALLTGFLSKIAKKQVGVTLSGAGGDEWFAGYNRHWGFYKYLTNYRTVKRFLPYLNGISNTLPTGYDHIFRKRFQLFKKFSRSLTTDPRKTFLNFTSFQLVDCPLENEKAAFSIENENLVVSAFSSALDYDRTQYLSSDILSLSDSMSMRYGLEMRMPYLDDRLTGFISSLPQTHLIKYGRKWILNSLLKKYGGNVYVKRGKEGFGLPFGNWIRDGHTEHLLGFLNNKKNIIFDFVSKDLIVNLLDHHKRRKSDNTLELWSIIILVNWLEKNFN